VYLLCSHSGESKIYLINLTLYGVLCNLIPLTDLLSNANILLGDIQVIFYLYFENLKATCEARNYNLSCIAIVSKRQFTVLVIRAECWTWK